VLEIEGGFHMDVLEAAADARRSRRLTTRTRTVVRCTAYELIHEMTEVGIDLIDLGIPGRLPRVVCLRTRHRSSCGTQPR
jgi:very-short-patch-repair endonuclease